VSRVRQTPRPEQVELLTSGVQLPLGALADEHLLVIIEGLARAWDDLVRAQRILATQDEPEITAMMESWLNASAAEDRRWEALVHSVVRGREMISFDGSRLELRPDLSILLTCPDRPSLSVIVECKHIDRTARKTVRLYCNEGLLRFVRGQYAWYAQEAFMLAYVRDGSTISDCLTPHLARHLAEDPYGYRTEQLPARVDRTPWDLARSKHGRCFRYMGTHSEPGPIILWHLWLAFGKLAARR